MQLNALYLRDFRNYNEAYIPFAPGVNVIAGDNAQGKTNLLEAIYFLVTGRSFRGAQLKDLVRTGADAFYLEAHFEKNGVTEVLRIASDGHERKIHYNATALPSLSALLGILLGVILSPEDDALIRGAPKTRRQFLDLQIAESSPLYLHHLSRFGRAMKQRNHLLKHQHERTLSVWEDELARSAAFLTLERESAIRDLENRATAYQKEVSIFKDTLSLRYKTSSKERERASLEDFFRAELQRQRPREMALGVTVVGPHRDDLEIYLEEKPARHYSSEGQMRTTAAALRLAEWARLHEITEERPLLCIDDLAISFDTGREGRFLEMLGQFGQVFVTTPRPKELPGSHLIFVQEGTISH